MEKETFLCYVSSRTQSSRNSYFYEKNKQDQLYFSYSTNSHANIGEVSNTLQ